MAGLCVIVYKKYFRNDVISVKREGKSIKESLKITHDIIAIVVYSHRFLGHLKCKSISLMLVLLNTVYTTLLLDLLGLLTATLLTNVLIMIAASHNRVGLCIYAKSAPISAIRGLLRQLNGDKNLVENSPNTYEVVLFGANDSYSTHRTQYSTTIREYYSAQIITIQVVQRRQLHPCGRLPAYV